MARYASGRSGIRALLALAVLAASITGLQTTAARADETFVIAASPSLKDVLEKLGNEFERRHAGVKVRLFLDSGLSLRQTIAGMENSMVGRYFVGSGPINLVAPGGDELITRLEGKYYVLPDGKRPYASDQLVLVVPESLVEAPESLDAISRSGARLSIADRSRTRLGVQTDDMLRALRFHDSLKGRLDVATDLRGVIDHVLSGRADAGIIYGHDAVKQQERVRVVAVINKGYQPTVHSMAMERYCPNRPLCEEFLSFVQGADGQAIVKQAGYAVPAGTGK
ncbi:MAG: Molybdenum ABC transporter, periplasmic molybdenum-binding protein ModA [Nitrospira sp.]|nr:MAG: Molybdenum ABC transporter, periplasmic molybdenum-binding protein ModA [Nitrospira sp.]